MHIFHRAAACDGGVSEIAGVGPASVGLEGALALGDAVHDAAAEHALGQVPSGRGHDAHCFVFKASRARDGTFGEIAFVGPAFAALKGKLFEIYEL